MSSSISVDTRLWELNITSSPGGSVSGSGSYYRQATVSVQATALPGYSFDSWSGNASGANNPISITMDGHKSISAVFVEEFILIPAGSFTMGRTSGEVYGDAPPVTVTLSAFYIGKNEVTKELWDEVYTWAKSNGYNDFSVFFNNGKPSNHPVTSISWFDAVKWCNARSQKEGLIPCYTVNGSVMKNGTTAPTMNWTANGYRLPTEAEWEKAARGGVSGKRFPWGGDTISHDQANYRSNTGFFHPIYSSNTVGPYTSPIGSFAENGYGLNDMAGNVWEWCWDWYGESSYVNDAADPRSIGSAAIYRVSRGGSWNENDWDCSAARRGAFGPMMAGGSNNGFRIARNAQNGNTVARDDQDNDGILDIREIHQLGTNPTLADSNANGLSDTYELIFQGGTEPFTPRLGDRVRYDLNRLGYQGTYKLVGTLPTGLTFNAVTGVLEGKLTGKAGLVKLSIQVLNGKTVLRTIPFQFTVLAFPSGLIGTWQVLLEDVNGSPQGMITTTISSPGAWSATYDSVGTKTLRSSKGVFDLTPAMDRAAFAVSFPVVSLTPAFSSSWQIDATTVLASGTYAQGTLRGFRLAKTGELPTASRQITMVIDQGEQDGYEIPAGLGWATGTLGTTGSLPLSGQLGDAQSLKTTVRLSATGQAMLWVKPYRNLNSFIGGIISLRDAGVLPQTPFTAIQNGLQWQRMADSAELSYSSGFGPIAADSAVNPHIKPTTALALATNLALTNNQFRNVTFDGGGLPNAEQLTAMPERFVMDSSYKLNPVPLPPRVMALWQGGISASAGTFTGTIALDASNSGILKGNASVSGVVFRRNDLETVGAGLIKIPTTGVKGSFRTGAFLMDR